MLRHRPLRTTLRTAFALRAAFALLFAVVQLLPLPTGAPARAQAAPLSNAVAQTTAPWLDAQLSGGIIYILYASPAQIQRYDTASQKWLSALALPGTPTAFRVDGSEILVAFDLTLARFNLDGTGRKNLWSNNLTILQVVVDHQFIFTCASEQYGFDYTYSINRTTGQKISETGSHIYCKGISSAPGLHKLFAHTKDTYPHTIVQLSYSDAGLLDFWTTIDAYAPSYQDAQKTWVFPNENLVVDDSGIVHNSSNLNYFSSLTGPIDDLAFYNNQPIALHSGIVYSYNDQMVEQSQYTPTQPPHNIFVVGENIYALRSETQGPVVEVIPVSKIQPPTPANPLDPLGVPYTIDGLAYDPGGIVYLLNKASRNILRWSAAAREYLDPIPLTYEPLFITYAPTMGKLFIAYNNKRITQIQPAEGLAETPFALLKSAPCALEAAGNVIVTCDTSEGLIAPLFSTLDANGSRVYWWTMYQGFQAFAWSSTQSRMYYLYQESRALHWFNLLPYGAVDGEGMYGDGMANAYNSPTRLSDDQTRLFAAPRNLYNISLTNVNIAGRLPEDVLDAAWFQGTLYTLKATNTGGQIQKWKADLTLEAAQDLPGSPLYLLPTGEGLLAISSFQGRPRFTLWNGELQPAHQPPAADFSASATYGISQLAVQFNNLSLFTESASYLWDFGDGQTSAEASPAHHYTQLGNYTVSLTVNGPDGKDRSVKNRLIHVVARTYLPSVLFNISTATYPTVTYTNACQTYPFTLPGDYHVADIAECVTKGENRGTLRMYMTWTVDLKALECVNKGSDFPNPNMYMTDQYGNRYDTINAGGAALGINCAAGGYLYTGWFDFPGPKIAGAVFTFHDDDNHILIGSLAEPK